MCDSGGKIWKYIKRPGVRLRLEVRVLKAEGIEMLVFLRVRHVEPANKADCDRLPQTHTTRCSSDASADGNESAKTTHCFAPMPLSRVQTDSESTAGSRR